MIEKIKALVLRAADFKENDKLLLLYCGEYGKITASIRGVKKPGAKLKFAAEPFCFGEFMLSVKDGRYAVTNCTEIESFFSLRGDVVTYCCAGCVVEQLANTGQENQSEPQLLLLALKTLKALEEKNAASKTILIKFLLESMKTSGFGLSFDKCSMCGSRTFDRMYLNLDIGGAVCPLCKHDCSSRELDARVFNCLRTVDLQPFERLSALRFNAFENDCLKALDAYVASVIKKLNSLQMLLKM